MKKRVLNVFFLVFYLLVVCTFLSGKIETEMAVSAECYLREMNAYSASEVTIGMRALFADEQGEHLYEVVEGIGWESGMRIQEIAGNLWSIDSRGVINLQSGRDYNIVYSASRQPETGNLADIIENWEEVTDQYLVIYPESVSVAEILQQPMDDERQLLPENVEIVGQSEHALLLNVESAKLPFLEHTAKAMLETIAVPGCRIFSLTEAVQFWESIPSVIASAAVLLLSLLLWGVSCYLSIHVDRNRVWILCNAGLMIGLLCVLQYLLRGLDLPASMLPDENIFDWQHYREAFLMISGAMEELTGNIYAISR